MIEKNASGKYVLTEEDAELLVRFSVYAKRTLANKRRSILEKLNPFWIMSISMKISLRRIRNAVRAAPSRWRRYLAKNGYGKSSARAFSFCRSRSAWSSSCSIRTNLPPRRLPGSWGSPALQLGLTRRTLSIS